MSFTSDQQSLHFAPKGVAMDRLVCIPIGGSLTTSVISIQEINRDYKTSETINPFYQQL